jgi:hypothetical protein
MQITFIRTSPHACAPRLKHIIASLDPSALVLDVAKIDSPETRSSVLALTQPLLTLAARCGVTRVFIFLSLPNAVALPFYPATIATTEACFTIIGDRDLEISETLAAARIPSGIPDVEPIPEDIEAHRAIIASQVDARDAALLATVADLEAVYYVTDFTALRTAWASSNA